MRRGSPAFADSIQKTDIAARAERARMRAVDDHRVHRRVVAPGFERAVNGMQHGGGQRVQRFRPVQLDKADAVGYVSRDFVADGGRGGNGHGELSAIARNELELNVITRPLRVPGGWVSAWMAAGCRALMAWSVSVPMAGLPADGRRSLSWTFCPTAWMAESTQ